MSHARHVNVARLPGVGDWWTPPDDPPWVECPCCDARGWVNKLDEDNKPFKDVCEACEGMKFLDAETGEPYDRAALAKLAEGE